MAILRSGLVKARKNHWCDGLKQIERNYVEGVAPDKYKCCGIKKGSLYFSQVSTHPDFGTFKSCKNCWGFIKKEELYDEV